ncbi:hypothetical protein MASR2M70_04230 [Bacillota bacterium]
MFATYLLVLFSISVEINGQSCQGDENAYAGMQGLADDCGDQNIQAPQYAHNGAKKI